MRNEERAMHAGATDIVFLSSSKPSDAEIDPEARLAQLAMAAGFTHYLFTTFPCGDCSGFEENHIFSNWPKVLTRTYHEDDLFHNSALVAELRKSSLPVFFDRTAFESSVANQKNDRIAALFQKHGLRRTFAFVLHDADRQAYIFAFSGHRGDLSRGEVMAHVFGAMEFLDLHARYKVTEQPLESLSSREIECLRWSAAGKSSEEIAIILDLSPHTVVGYLKSAMRKLDSVNRMQAVARAFRYRLL